MNAKNKTCQQNAKPVSIITKQKKKNNFFFKYKKIKIKII